MKKITKYENFLSEELFEKVHKHIQEIIKGDSSFKISNFVWKNYIVLESAPVLLYTLDSENTPFFDELVNEIETKTQYTLTVPIVNFYIWTNSSYIPWHDDGLYSAGLTIYLNTEWDLNWGGLFLYKEENNEIKSVAPQKNRAVLQEGGVPHSVTMTTSSASYRYTLQLFFKHKDKSNKTLL